MTRVEFEDEVRNIILLLADHAEYRYRYPAKYEEVRSSVLFQFKSLIEKKSGLRFPSAVEDLPLETMKDYSLASVHRMMSSVRGRLNREIAKRQGRMPTDHLVKALETYDLILEKLVH